MKFTTGFVLACATAQLALVNAQDDAIIGGTNVATDNYQFTVSLQTSGNRHFCGGSLIGPSTVLTAAHCVSNGQTNFRVLAGTTDLRGGRGKAGQPKRVYVHPQYDSSNIRNDIAIVELRSPITGIAPIAFDKSTSLSGNVILSGWGLTRGGNNNSGASRMQEVRVPVVPNRTCKAANNTFNEFLKDEMICIGFQNGGQGACNGDSGGPMFNTAASLQYGLTSWGIQGCGSYGVYTRLGSYAGYIQGLLDDIEGTNPTNPPTNGPNPTNPPTKAPESCRCIGDSNGALTEGETCGRWLNQNFNWCYAAEECEDSKPSARYPGYHYINCTPARLDIFQQFEHEAAGNNFASSEGPAEFSTQSKDVSTTEATSEFSAPAVGMMGAGIAFVASAGAFVIFKRSKDASVADAMKRAEEERIAISA